MINYIVNQQLNNADAIYNFNGCINEYINAVTDNWLLIAPDANSGMLEILRDRDRTPYRNMVPWAGEFAGKYLTAATQIMRCGNNIELKKYLSKFVDELISLQDEDGYLGPWPENFRMKNHVVYNDRPVFNTWDTWGHYHVVIGLIMYYESTGTESALLSACKIADMFCIKYDGKSSPRLVETKSTEMNMAFVHGLTLLYRHTGKSIYLSTAKMIVDEEFGMKDADGNYLAGDWFRGSLNGLDFYQLPRPRWEALHPIMAIADLYWLTGDEDYKKAFVQIWNSIVKFDRHNNGGFSSGEQAQGNPYHQGAIETCCTIAWMALTVEMLKLSGDSKVADELEISLYNSIIGIHNFTGRWATYNTPMDGVRIASAQEIVFQSREGTPELNCCSVNSARGFGMISDWAVMTDNKGIKLNLYEPGCITINLPSNNKVKVNIETEYPAKNVIKIVINPENNEKFGISLRIPAWSANTVVNLNGQSVDNVTPGTYFTLEKDWKSGDCIELILDFSTHCWVGEKECAGKISLYRGPILLTYDRKYNIIDPGAIHLIDANNIIVNDIQWDGRLKPIVLVELINGDKGKINLCDFGSAGEGGSPYISWLPVGDDDIKISQFLY